MNAIREWISRSDSRVLKIRFSAKHAAGAVLFCLMPVLSYVLFEYLTGNLAFISPGKAVLNILWIGVLYLIILMISGTTRIAVPAASVIFFILSLAESFVELFRGTPIMIWDILSFGTAVTVMENYVFEFTYEMFFAGGVLLTANIIVWFFPLRVRGMIKRLVLCLSCAGAVVGYVFYFFAVFMPGSGYYLNMWDLNDTYRNYGYVLSTVVSLKYIMQKPPEGYSSLTVKLLAQQMQENSMDEEESSSDASVRAFTASSDGSESVQPVNLVCIMNESLAELKVAGDFTTNAPYFSYLDSLKENTVRGSLCVPVFGAGTSSTEYEFLSGDSVAFLPSGSNAYQLFVKPGALTLVSTLKAQGYEAVAMHPYPAENWNRKTCYSNMGFDAFYAYEEYEDSELLRNYVSDRADYEKIIELVEKKESPDDRLFVFNVTMQNHGGYEETYDNFDQQIFLTGDMEGMYPWADQFLSLMKESDEAFEYLTDYFSSCTEPTMIVLFGDHQPSVEDAFYDDIYGVPSTEVDTPEHLMWYQTPFVIWTNYDMPSADMGKLGCIYLSSWVLKLANLEMTPYNSFLLEMSKEVPVVCPIGIYDADGVYYSWEQTFSQECPYMEQVLKYAYMAYNHSIDKKKETSLFSLAQGD